MEQRAIENAQQEDSLNINDTGGTTASVHKNAAKQSAYSCGKNQALKYNPHNKKPKKMYKKIIDKI